MSRTSTGHRSSRYTRVSGSQKLQAHTITENSQMNRTVCIPVALVLLARIASAAADPPTPPAPVDSPAGTSALPTEPDVTPTPGLVPQPALEGMTAAPDNKPAGGMNPAQPPVATPDNCITADCLEDG